MNQPNSPETMVWHGAADGHLVLIDQTKLPVELTYVECRDVETVWEAIKMLRVRGAPAIGIAAAYGVVVGLQTVDDEPSAFASRLTEVTDYLATSRPTAVNLFWALDRIKACVDASASVATQRETILAEALKIHEEDREVCHAIGRYGAELLAEGQGVLTHCNAGGLRLRIKAKIFTYSLTKHDRCCKVRD